jgi:glutamine cyclotransferase
MAAALNASSVSQCVRGRTLRLRMGARCSILVRMQLFRRAAALAWLAAAGWLRAAAPPYGVQVVNVFPHDRGAFTEGLAYLQGALFEGTGLNGSSTLRQVDLRTGKVARQIALPSAYFGEGIAILGDKLYQLTWKAHKGFIYDLATFAKLGEFSYEGEGWGLTTDGKVLIMSDGTPRIRFVDPADFHVIRSISVSLAGKPLANLNELEYVKGEIYANVWQTPIVVRIAPADGTLTGTIDLTGLLSLSDYDSHTDVLNGIAYDPDGDRLFVTGKNWPKLFEVRLRAK